MSEPMPPISGSRPLVCCLMGAGGGAGIFALGIDEGGFAGNMGLPTVSGLLAMSVGPILVILTIIGISLAISTLRDARDVDGPSVMARRQAWAAILIGVLSFVVLAPSFARLKQISARMDRGGRTTWEAFWDRSYPQ